MESLELPSMIEQLDENIDDLGAALNLLLENSLVENAQKLPPLERSKLYVLVTYAIESLMFSLLRLNGINAKEHPVFRELTRVKQYFEKIKVAEFGEEQQAPPRMRVDQPAAGRMLKHALATGGQVKNGHGAVDSVTGDPPSKKRKTEEAKP